MNLKAKISSGQFFSLLLLSRFISVLTYSPIYNAGLNSSDYLIAGVIGMIMVLFSCLPLALIYKSNDNRSVLDMAYEISPIYSKIISVLYILLFLFYAFSALSRLDLFSGTVIFRESDTKVFVVLSVLLACYSAYLGLEALGRAGAISLFVFSVSFVFIIVTMLSKLDLNNFSPVFYDGAGRVISAGQTMAVRTIEPAAMAVLFPRVSGNKKRGFFIWMSVLTAFLEIVFFFVFSGLGDYAMTQLFPIHSIAVLSEFSVFQRIDVILTGVWILSAFIKISFMLYLSSYIASRSFSAKYKKIYIFAFGAAAVILQFVVSKNVTGFLISTSNDIRSVLFYVVVIFIPLLTFALGKFRRKEQRNI